MKFQKENQTSFDVHKRTPESKKQITIKLNYRQKLAQKSALEDKNHKQCRTTHLMKPMTHVTNDTVYVTTDTVDVTNDTVYVTNAREYVTTDTIYVTNDTVYVTNDTAYITQLKVLHCMSWIRQF